MAGRGPAPAETRQRGRDNKRQTLSYDGTSVWGDPLPDDIPAPTREDPEATLQWHPMTVRWWEAWRQWPLMKDAHPVAWQNMIATALMHHTMWTKGKWEFASEIRLREGKFGATPMDLRSLGYDYELEGTKDEDGNDTAPGTVTDLASRKLQLLADDAPPVPVKKAPVRKRAPAKKAVAKKVAAKKAPTKKSPAKVVAKPVAAKKATSRVKIPDGMEKPPY